MDLIIPVNAEEVIKTNYSPAIISRMVFLVEQGYILAREATKHISFLDWEIGEYHEGYLRPIAINYLFKKDVEEGLLPFTMKTEYNRNKSHKFLLFEQGSTKMTISQVSSSRAVARKAYFRTKLQEANQVSFNLFKDELQVSDEQEQYLLLTFNSGGEEPRFVNLGIPGEKYWQYKLNLMKEPREIIVPNRDLEKEEIITAPDTFFGLQKFIKEVEGSGNG